MEKVNKKLLQTQMDKINEIVNMLQKEFSSVDFTDGIDF
jgi:hypothetical protein